jgi:hypothetical protein
MTESTVDLSFPHDWQAEILKARPAILPARRFVYPRDVEEVERGALELLVRPGTLSAGSSAEPFLATCALGFRDPAVPAGIWSCPIPQELCAVAGGYAYVIDTTAPERFTMISFRPVLEICAAAADGLLLFVGHHAILGWGRSGLAWQSEKLSDEGLTIARIDPGILHGHGWNMRTDKETAFALDLRNGQRVITPT